MTDRNPARAIDVVRRVAMMRDFFENQEIKNAVERAVPVCMPRLPGALGFDMSLWVGLATVGLWAALDGFAERAALPRPKCKICTRCCVPARFAGHVQGDERRSIEELEDLRNLYAHNYAGETDDEYFNFGRKRRHVLIRNTLVKLTCGAQFNGQRVHLDLPHLQMYSRTVQSLLERFQ
jgi:hypothetical protein